MLRHSYICRMRSQVHRLVWGTGYRCQVGFPAENRATSVAYQILLQGPLVYDFTFSLEPMKLLVP
jgi:hypothetical protein